MFHKNLNKFTPITPHKLRPQEEERINPGYINITKGDAFTPVANVLYIWIYTAEKELIVGVKKPWMHPEAFFNANALEEITSKDWWKKTSKDWEEAGRIGHPTLSDAFEQTGEASPQKSRVLIGGKIILNEDNTIGIYNKSGRFGNVKNDPIDALYLLHEIKDLFAKAIRIQAKFNIKLVLKNPKVDYLPSYYKIWEKSNDELSSALSLLRSYLESNAASDAGKRVTQEMLNHHSPDSISMLINYFEPHLTTLDDEELKNRLNFIAGQTNYFSDTATSFENAQSSESNEDLSFYGSKALLFMPFQKELTPEISNEMPSLVMGQS